MTRPIRLILDATAVHAFPHLDIGEPITQVQENGAAFTVPLAAIVAAKHPDPRLLRYLLAHPAHQEADISFDAWPALVEMATLLGTFDAACCLWLSTVYDCLILTGDAKVWAPLGDDPPIIVF